MTAPLKYVSALQVCLVAMLTLAAPSTLASALPEYFIVVALSKTTMPACRERNMPGADNLNQEYADWLVRQTREVREGIRNLNAQIDAQTTPATLQQSRDEVARMSDAMLRVQCEGLSAVLRGAVAQSAPSRATVQSTWDGFVTAMRAGDKHAARQFLGGAARDNFESVFGSTDSRKMQEWAAQIQHIALKAGKSSEPPLSAFVTMQSGRGSFVTFDKAGTTWIIVAM